MQRAQGLAEAEILIVENHALMRMLLRAMLRGFGVARIVEARDVPEALKLARAERFDAIVLDFFLGAQDGADFAREVRRDPACVNRQTPILLITSAPEHAKVIKARDAGVDAMMGKPIAPSDLHRRLEQLLLAPRPFVVTTDYAGPLRRRTQWPAAGARQP
jgi:two-component system chemotaxis response regulator CheY